MKQSRLFSFLALGSFALLMGGCFTSQPTVTPPDGTVSAPVERPADAGGLITLGEVEPVQLVTEGNPVLAARIDSGAQTSSLGASGITFMERDGKKWARFQLQDARKTKMERPVARMMKIKRHDAKAQERPVVMLDIRLGGKTLKREFSLADREKFAYPALIGRNVLQGHYLIDVSKKNITSPLSERGNNE